MANNSYIVNNLVRCPWNGCWNGSKVSLEWIVVIHFGRKIAEGAPKQVASNENVIKAYLGDEYAVS